MEIWRSGTPVMRTRTRRNGRPTAGTVGSLLIASDDESGESWSRVKGELADIPWGTAEEAAEELDGAMDDLKRASGG